MYDSTIHVYILPPSLNKIIMTFVGQEVGKYLFGTVTILT